MLYKLIELNAGAHPRRCGEHTPPAGKPRRYTGSSPQVRGTSQFYSCRVVTGGLIPAGAGNITLTRRRPITWRAHPRRCGEHISGGAQVKTHKGSSPQVRGTLVVNKQLYIFLGLIPAGAGNIYADVINRSVCGAHPRRCGEHDSQSIRSFRLLGSSPQVRGTFG